MSDTPDVLTLAEIEQAFEEAFDGHELHAESVAFARGIERRVQQKLYPCNAQIAKLQAERDVLKIDRDRACKLVADMHAAAMGGMVGPALGVIEDIAALRAEREALQGMLTAMADRREDWPEVILSRAAIAKAGGEA